MKYKVGSMFAGIGGICLGFQNAKNETDEYELVWANEIDEYACETYRNNFKHKLLEGDINLILDPSKATNNQYYQELKNEIIKQGKIDVLNGGFPCQAFSIAGEQKGFEDERGNLFLSIIEVVYLLEEYYEKPRVLFLENVKNLQSHDKGRTYQIIKSKIESLGYIVKEKVLNTMYFSSLPQNRERIYIVCFRDKADADNFTMFDNLDLYKKTFTQNDRIKQIDSIIDYSKKINQKYYYTKEKYPHYFKEEETGINLDRDINEKYQFYQCRRGMYVRKNKSNVCPTLTANMGTGGHNVPLILTDEGIRKLTPTETLRLQGFPVGKGYIIPSEFKGKKFGDANLYKQAGNAVSVPVIELIAKEILNALSKTDKEKNIQIKSNHNIEKVELTNMCMIYDSLGNVLVQNRKKSWCGIAFPGGHVEINESVVDSTIREIKEETGLIISNLSICGIKQWFTDDVRHICFLFKTSCFNGNLVPKTEEGEVFWVPKADLSKYELASNFDIMLNIFESDNLNEHYITMEENHYKHNLK